MEVNASPIQSLKKPAIILVGMTGSGKSTFGNRLYQFLTGDSEEEIFKVGSSMCSETEISQSHLVKIENKEYELIDTPGIFDSSCSDEHVVAEITKTVQKCAYGVQAVLFVLEYGRLKPQERKALTVIMSFFGENVISNMILVFSKTGAKMTTDRTLLDMELMRDLPIRNGKIQENPIKDLILSVNNRWVISPNPDMFSNPNDHDWIREANILVRHIMSLQRPYTTDMFERIRLNRERSEEEIRLAKEKEESILREQREEYNRMREESKMSQQDMKKMLEQMERCQRESAQRMEDIMRENERRQADMARDEVERNLRRRNEELERENNKLKGKSGGVCGLM